MDPPWENKHVKRVKGYSMMSNEDVKALPLPKLVCMIYTGCSIWSDWVWLIYDVPAAQQLSHFCQLPISPRRTGQRVAQPITKSTQPTIRPDGPPCTGWGGHLFWRFCLLFSESSPGCWAVLQLPCKPYKQGELLENILRNLRNKWPPHPVKLMPQDIELQVLQCR